MTHRWIKPLTFILCLAPLAFLASDALAGAYAAKPPDFIPRTLGELTLRFLLVTLAVTPLRLVTGWNEIVRLRRMLGLFAFTYAVLHVLAYLGTEHQFDAAQVWQDVLKRPYILVGVFGLALMLPLAITSTNAMVRWIGGVRWRALHRLAYLVAVVGVIHSALMAKGSAEKAWLYGFVLAVLLAARAAHRSATSMASSAGPSHRGTFPQRPMSL